MRQVWRVFWCALFLSGVQLSTAAEAQITPLDAAGLNSELATARGNVVVVNFWATWCRPCLDEIPLLQNIEAEFAERDFRLISVSLDELEGMETQVIPFMQKWFPDYESYQSVEYEMDTMVSAIDANWNEVLPTTYLLARDGRVAKLIQGQFSQDGLAADIATLLTTD